MQVPPEPEQELSVQIVASSPFSPSRHGSHRATSLMTAGSEKRRIERDSSRIRIRLEYRDGMPQTLDNCTDN